MFLTAKKSKAKESAILDQIVIGINNETTQEKAKLKNWNLQEHHQYGMKYESAVTGEELISGGAIKKLGSYLYHRFKKSNNPKKE